MFSSFDPVWIDHCSQIHGELIWHPSFETTCESVLSMSGLSFGYATKGKRRKGHPNTLPASDPQWRVESDVACGQASNRLQPKHSTKTKCSLHGLQSDPWSTIPWAFSNILSSPLCHNDLNTLTGRIRMLSGARIGHVVVSLVAAL